MAGGVAARRARRNMAATLWVAASFGAFSVGFTHLTDPLAWMVFVNGILWGLTGPYIVIREHRHSEHMHEIRKTYERKARENSVRAVAALRARGLTGTEHSRDS